MESTLVSMLQPGSWTLSGDYGDSTQNVNKDVPWRKQQIWIVSVAQWQNSDLGCTRPGFHPQCCTHTKRNLDSFVFPEKDNRSKSQEGAPHATEQPRAQVQMHCCSCLQPILSVLSLLARAAGRHTVALTDLELPV